MADFRLLNLVGEDGRPTPGILSGDRVLPLSDCPAVGSAAGSTLDILADWPAARPRLDAAAAADRGVPIAEARLAAPLLYPPTIFCAAANYSDHLHEMTGKEPDKSALAPYFFIKSSRAVIGPGERITLPRRHTRKVDWEAEIAVVIGREARGVSADAAMDFVAGYTILNDLSARDHIFREDWPFRTDWFGQKSFDTSAPMGPWITPADLIADPHDLAIKLWVNDTIEQDSSSRYMIFTIPEQIEALSRQITLRPGDVIATGTCAGVGHVKQRFLNAGDRVRIEIEGLGALENPVTETD